LGVADFRLYLVHLVRVSVYTINRETETGKIVKIIKTIKAYRRRKTFLAYKLKQLEKGAL